MVINDWRIRWQEDYLKNKTIYNHLYNGWSQRWNHEHCEFCWKKLEQNKIDSDEWYSTLDNYYWVCKECYNDFKDKLSFVDYDAKNFENKKLLDILIQEIGKLQGIYDVFQISRVINVISKTKEIKTINISVRIKPVIVKISSNRKIKPIIEYVKANEVELLNANNEELYRELIRMTDAMQVYGDGSTIFINIENIN